MYVSKDKKTAINTDLVETVRIGSDDSVLLSLGANTITLDGDDAKAVADEFGLTTHAEDEAAAQKKSEHAHATQAPAPAKK